MSTSASDNDLECIKIDQAIRHIATLAKSKFFKNTTTIDQPTSVSPQTRNYKLTWRYWDLESAQLKDGQLEVAYETDPSSAKKLEAYRIMQEMVKDEKERIMAPYLIKHMQMQIYGELLLNLRAHYLLIGHAELLEAAFKGPKYQLCSTMDFYPHNAWVSGELDEKKVDTLYEALGGSQLRALENLHEILSGLGKSRLGEELRDMFERPRLESHEAALN
ncbi:hypothetical protein M011DRAFT_479724 [Sporormia fimetaria CBS 119925]|uniref:Uncharacterized protein n=1 Tax=Sporormia fimetaria CBS 119925 TaxID=1340428 RepID=A0A6A6V596_9PLEO|nr:hypothetical protein M011DRAFT_479724 [Sporormia fimetaria CBS 119925]